MPSPPTSASTSPPPRTPELTTKPATPFIATGASETDTATVTGDGGITPTGSVTFFTCGPTPNPTACTAANDSELGGPVGLAGSGDHRHRHERPLHPHCPRRLLLLGRLPRQRPLRAPAGSTDCFTANAPPTARRFGRSAPRPTPSAHPRSRVRPLASGRVQRAQPMPGRTTWPGRLAVRTSPSFTMGTPFTMVQ